MRTTKDIVESQILSRFGGSIPETDECVIWPYRCTGNGYGHTQTRRRGSARKNEYIHRLIWEYVNGRPPAKGKHIMHGCDTPPCFNPRHLTEGEPSQNALERGTRERRRVVPYPVVEQIRERLVMGQSQVSIAKEFGLSQGYVAHLKSGRIKRNGKACSAMRF